MKAADQSPLPLLVFSLSCSRFATVEVSVIALRDGVRDLVGLIEREAHGISILDVEEDKIMSSLGQLSRAE